MSRNWKSWIAGLVVGLLGPAYQHANAYCVRSEPLAPFWTVKFPDLRIPVWINISPRNTVAQTGQDPHDVARVTLEVIARHNESVRGPKLYLAGFTEQEFDLTIATEDIPAAAKLPAGVTLMGMPCEENVELCGSGATGCAGFATRGEFGPPPTHSDPLGWVFFVPPGCDDSAGFSMNSYGDMAQVMLHELGHVLGLQHSNRTKSVCEAGGNIHVGPADGTSGVMNTALPAGFAAERSWRRDDLEGLDHLYGAAAPTYELAWWDDAGYPDYPEDSAATSLIGMEVSRTAVVSNRAPSGVQALVSTAPDGRVIHRVLDQQGDASPELDEMIVDPGPSGVTWSLPAVAMSEAGPSERVFVAWMANETQLDRDLTLRTAVRATNGATWQYSDHPDEFQVNRVAAGFDAGTQTFVVTTVGLFATELQIVLFDIDGASLGPAITLEGVQVFGAGAPLCEGSRCLIPFSESEFGGPDFGVAEVIIDPRTPAVSLLSSEVLSAANTYGGLTLLEDQPGLLAGTGERRFFVGDYPGLAADGVEGFHNPNTDWALGVGQWGSVDLSERRLLQPRVVECGDGIVAAAEECDDANEIIGDGCDACALAAGTNSETGGDGGLDTDNGCECRADAEGQAWLGFLSMFGIVALALHTRRSS